MKKLYFLSIILFFISCSEKKDDDIVVEKKYNNNGLLIEETPRTKEGLIHGRKIKFYNNGDTMLYSTWKYGKKYGIEKSFYSNGQVEYIVFYLNNKLDGPMKGYYMSGNMFQSALYKDGVHYGKLVEYFDLDSQKISTINHYINFKGAEKLMGWVNFKKDGSIESQESRIEIFSSKDTVNFGDSVSIQLSLVAPKYESTYFFIGNYDDKFFLKVPHKIDTIFSQNHKIRYNEKALHKGINYIRGGAKNYGVLPAKNMLRRVILRPELYFEYSYYVH